MVLLATQIALPPYLEHRIADRLESHGGTARVDLEQLDPDAKLFDRLDGFDRSRISLSDVNAGPFSVSTFLLARPDGADEYGLRMTGRTSARRISDYAASRLPGLLGPLLSGTSETLGLGTRPIPFDVAARLRSEDGRARVGASRGRIAGLDAGPFTQLLVNAIAARL